MTRHPHDLRSSSPAVQRARERAEARKTPIKVLDLDVHVDELDEGGVDLQQELPVALISELLDDKKVPRWTGREPASIDLHLELEATFVRVTGSTKFHLSHPCVRCLNDVPFDFDMAVDLRLVERAAGGPVEADYSEGASDDDTAGAPLGDAADLEDLDVASYAAGHVKIGELLREQLFLELPLHPACDSRGAHPTEPCAFDEKEANAGEVKGWSAARWAGLAALRDKLPPATDKKPREPRDEKRAGNKRDVVAAVRVASATDEAVPLPGRESGYLAKANGHGANEKNGARDTETEPTNPATPAAKVRATKPAATATKKAKPAAKTKAKPAATAKKKAQPAATAKKKAKPAATSKKKAKPAAKKKAKARRK